MKKSNIGDIIQFGGYDWRVLAVKKNKVLIITENIVELRPFNNDEEQDNTWEHSTIRKYLNEEFFVNLNVPTSTIADTYIYSWYNLKSAGTPDDESDAQEDDDPDSIASPLKGITAAPPTVDKIFLLSLYEVCKYFGDSRARLKKIKRDIWCIEDLNNSNRVALDADGKPCWWWLRSPARCRMNDAATGILTDGAVDIDGVDIGWENGGVRPAMWVYVTF